MEQAVTVEEVIHRNDIVFIDVRSPKEFTGLQSPVRLISPVCNAEREELGLIYHHEGEVTARRIAGPGSTKITGPG